jgi:ribonuclease E
VDDTDDIDFVNHPSYQERGGLNNNRRRRRRRPDEPVPKEELISKGSPRPTPLIQLKSEPIVEADDVRFSEAVSFPQRDAIPSRELGVPGRTPMLEPPAERIAKPQLIKSPRETEPPEVISIEMTPEEQDVYALMGISPLVRLNREVKNPKSVIVSVVLPGESDLTETSNPAPVEDFREAPLFSYASDEAETSHNVLMNSSAVANAADEAGTSEMALVTSSAEAPATEIPTYSIPIDESDSSRPLIRRRRRRSSATDSEDSTASES